MPNWCSNRVTVSGTEEDISKISDIFSDKKSIFDRIIQSPDWKRLPNEKGEFPKLRQELNKDGSVFYETYDFPDGKNDDRWYHWCISNWGTKWDCCELDIDYQDDEQLDLTFSTAWSPPEGIVEKLREKYPKLNFSCFYDEPGMEVAGYY